MKTINRNAPVKCRKTVTINASIDKVWAALTDINKWSAWQTVISKSAMPGELKPDTTFDWKSGGAEIHSSIHTVEPFRYFGWTGKSMGMHALHNWTLKGKDGQTDVLVEESMEGFIASLLRKPLNRSLEKGMHRWLSLLKLECEKEQREGHNLHKPSPQTHSTRGIDLFILVYES